MNPSITQSVPSPVQSAFNSALVYYDPNVSRDVAGRRIGVPESTLTRVSPRCIAALFVIFTWAMRATEYLSVTALDVASGDFVFIRGRKGSASYRIMLPGIWQQFEHDHFQRPGRLVAGMKYHQLWTGCMRLGIGELLPGHINATRTHISRHDLAAQYQEKGEVIAGDLLHHKSKRSIKYYMVRRS